MTQLLVLRERMIKLYQKYAPVLNALFRFVIAYVSFSSVNRMVGYSPELNHFYVEFVLALIGMILPGSVLVFAVAAFVVCNIYYVSGILALVVALLFLVLYLLYIKFVPAHGYIVLAFPILMSMHLAYGIPIYLGLVMTPVAVVPIICGGGIYYLLQTITSVISTSTDTGINLYQTVLGQLGKSEQMYAVVAIFSVVTIVVYILRNREKDYAFETSVVAGTILNIVLFLVVNYALGMHLNVLKLLLGSVISMLLVFVYQFMHLALNYAGVENLQFEDEEYYYYVRAVPKISVTAPDKNVKKFNVRHFAENSAIAGKRGGNRKEEKN